MARLLVSVRSVNEALLAWRAGVDVIDVKEPSRGPLGQADPSIWREIRAVLPPSVPVSVALGEWWELQGTLAERGDTLLVADYQKLGPARSALAPRDYHRLTERFWGPGWVAVAYADWPSADALSPTEILDHAIRAGCSGFLIDTFRKTGSSPLDATWRSLVEHAQDAGLFVAVAGGLSTARIQTLHGLRPELFAVRGAACGAGDRRGSLDPRRLRELIRAVKPDSQGVEPAVSEPWPRAQERHRPALLQIPLERSDARAPR